MPQPSKPGLFDLPEELHQRKQIIFGDLKDRTLWFIKLRWWVPPSFVVGTFAARSIGVDIEAKAFFAVALFILGYNIVFYRWSRRLEARVYPPRDILLFTYFQMGFDYGALFLLIYFTGGTASPFIFFFIFHITFSAIFLPRRSAYGFAFFAVIGLGLIAISEYVGWISHRAMTFHGSAIELSDQPLHMVVVLGFFAGFAFFTAFSLSAAMNMLANRVLGLAELNEAVTALNDKLNALYAMTQAIGSMQHLNQVLNIVTLELARVMEVQAISVKLLTEDGKFLRFAAAYGLPLDLMNKVLELEKSAINRRVIEGEPFVTGRVTQSEYFQFGEDLSAAGVQSVQFVPLTVQNRVIGILGAYSSRPERFGSEEVTFFQQAAGLVAIAIENARAYEAIEDLIQERSRFMNRVAHNLRAPLAATANMIEVVQGGYLGGLAESAQKHLSRVSRRVEDMLLMINELMTLAKSQSKRHTVEYGPIDLKALAGRIQQTFQEESTKKRLSFDVRFSEALAEMDGDQEMVEQMLENLVSNAIKYTPEGGHVDLTFQMEPNGTVCIVLRDSGIGIPRAEMSRLFTEFFRASNVQHVTGTGLGLAIVKEIVEQHHGQIQVESQEGAGTSFIVHLPISCEEEGRKKTLPPY